MSQSPQDISFGYKPYDSSGHRKRNPPRYRDLDLSLSPHPITGSVSVLEDAEAVKRSIRQLVLTNNYERPFQPDLGSNVTAFLFTPSSAPFVTYQLENQIKDTIRAYEKRVDSLKVKVKSNEDLNGFDVQIAFSILQIVEVQEITMFLRRTR